MAFAERFEDLEVWKKAKCLLVQIYSAFKHCRDFALRDQIQRAALSVMNNIAEGFERRTRKDFAHFLDQAKGSSGEVRSILHAAQDLAYLESHSAVELRNEYELLSRSLGALASKLRGNRNS
jgi:four helix bundle protein